MFCELCFPKRSEIACLMLCNLVSAIGNWYHTRSRHVPLVEA
jgi:hypothetical protein